MSDLERFREHARVMSTAEHKPECREWVNRPSRWGWQDGRWVAPAPSCGGCVTAADRALFALLAAEVDEYLSPPTTEDLFGEMSTETAVGGGESGE